MSLGVDQSELSGVAVPIEDRPTRRDVLVPDSHRPQPLCHPGIATAFAGRGSCSALGSSSGDRRRGGGQVGGDVAPGALDVLLLLADRSNVVQRALSGVLAIEAGDDPRR